MGKVSDVLEIITVFSAWLYSSRGCWKSQKKNATNGVDPSWRWFQRFIRGEANHPTFKKKGIHDSFTLTNDQFALSDKHIRVPNLGWVRMRETLRFSGKFMSATVWRKADKWFASITVDAEETPLVDLGVNRLVTMSDGTSSSLRIETSKE